MFGEQTVHPIKNGHNVKHVQITFFFLLWQRAVGSFGLSGLDRLLCFMMVRELQNFQRLLQRQVLKDKNWVDYFSQVTRTLNPLQGLVRE